VESLIIAFSENEEFTHLDPLVDADAGDPMDIQNGALSKIEELTQLEPLANADAGKYMDNYDPVYSYTPPYYTKKLFNKSN
jgi:hypothetical protein